MRIVVAAIFLCACTPAAAQHWVSTLKNSPAESFTKEDTRLFEQAWQKALNGDEQLVRWENPQTRSRGDISVQRRFEWKGYPCKEMRLHNEAAGRTGDSTLSACQVDGKWRLVSSDQLKSKK